VPAEVGLPHAYARAISIGFAGADFNPAKNDSVRGSSVAAITIKVPDQFLSVMDELVTQTGAGSREIYLRNLVANILIDYEMRKEFGANMQARTQQLMAMWT
jgi:hypothetical protein